MGYQQLIEQFKKKLSYASLRGYSRLVWQCALYPRGPSFHITRADRSLIHLIIERALFLHIFDISFAEDGLNGLSTSPIDCEPIPIGQVAFVHILQGNLVTRQTFGLSDQSYAVPYFVLTPSMLTRTFTV